MTPTPVPTPRKAAGILIAAALVFVGWTASATAVEFNTPPDSIDALVQTTSSEGDHYVVGDGVTVNVNGNTSDLPFLVTSGGAVNLTPSLSPDHFAEGAYAVSEGGAVGVSSGTLFDYAGRSGSRLSVDGGTVVYASAQGGSEVEINDGTIYTLSVFEGHVTMSGGKLLDLILGGVSDVEPSVFDVLGGDLGESITWIGSLSTMNLRGGAHDYSTLWLVVDGVLNLYGTDFVVDGSPISLAAGEQIVVPDRNVTYAGVLEDGSPFDFYLADESDGGIGGIRVPNGGVVRLIGAIPEPSALALIVLAHAAIAGLGRRVAIVRE
ncbi:hypothetical protein Mal64_25840 [Pseudobythopirellula maris]|uniref:PEP-CTERM protein-sorting domain-containing protein n=1 Tax=Pseudobythopirellula maris TaxID=2527991 RepID=A0A5C5ZNL7_9BACT|nr:hypothetical protein [Pseudobythopirellula maris]TWT89092.1 hypothetical protein Mal64_25840 [Pseudobythopirellula maris]